MSTRETERAARQLRNVASFMRRSISGELTGWTKGDRGDAALNMLRRIDTDALTDKQLERWLYLERWAIRGKAYADDHAATTNTYRVQS